MTEQTFGEYVDETMELFRAYVAQGRNDREAATLVGDRYGLQTAVVAEMARSRGLWRGR